MAAVVTQQVEVNVSADLWSFLTCRLSVTTSRLSAAFSAASTWTQQSWTHRAAMLSQWSNVVLQQFMKLLTPQTANEFLNVLQKPGQLFLCAWDRQAGRLFEVQVNLHLTCSSPVEFLTTGSAVEQCFKDTCRWCEPHPAAAFMLIWENWIQTLDERRENLTTALFLYKMTRISSLVLFQRFRTRDQLCC